jgi:hypothetical protein
MTLQWTYKSFEDKGEDRKRTTELRVNPHQQNLPSMLYAVRARKCPTKCPLAQDYYTE